MRYRVVISDAARFDLLDIGRYIKLSNPPRSESFVAELFQRCRSLEDFPESHALIDDAKSRGVRRLVHGNYLVFYRIAGSTVEVLHVLNGARDYAALLFPDDER
jgi:toxin ParE1/3/4